MARVWTLAEHLKTKLCMVHVNEAALWTLGYWALCAGVRVCGLKCACVCVHACVGVCACVCVSCTKFSYSALLSMMLEFLIDGMTNGNGLAE
jgi:hypothetical protein